MADSRMQASDLIAMYSAYPGALAYELSCVLRILRTDEERVGHNCALSRFIGLFGTMEAADQLFLNLARTIIDSAIQLGEFTDGKAK